MKICAILILVVFYAIYFFKMMMQRKKGIVTNQIAKGKEHSKLFYTEVVMKIATYAVVPFELASIFLLGSETSIFISIIGVIVGIFGDIIFGISVYTMKDSWRAGITEKENTELVTNGIYSYSRNPAFLAFNLMYISILIMFFNIMLLIFTTFAIVMLHLQILQEEKHLEKTFGDKYKEYKKNVNRYIGVRKLNKTK